MAKSKTGQMLGISVVELAWISKRKSKNCREASCCTHIGKRRGMVGAGEGELIGALWERGKSARADTELEAISLLRLEPAIGGGRVYGTVRE